MTLDPVHFDGIARMARRIEHGVDDREYQDLATKAWDHFLDPLVADGRTVLEPVERQFRVRVPAETAALWPAAFETVHGLDSGTINPRTFRNGLVLDVAQAAMATSPSSLDLHRSRTVVATVHSHDATVHLPDAWDRWDQGYSRGRVLRAPRVDQYEEAVVHALSLYFAESSHALHHGDDVEDLLVLDGPLYPTGMVNWLDRHPELAALLADEDMPREVVMNYLTLVEDFVERDVPLVGFVKTVASKAVRRALADALSQAPWANDASFFAQALGAAGDGPGGGTDLLATNWFVSRGGTDRVFAADSGELGLDRARPPADYEVTFCVVYDPRTDLVYKAEAPLAFTRDRETRERLTRYLLGAVATTRGPPEAVQKADSLARISAAERESLIETLERTFQSARARTYDEERWGERSGE